MNKKIGRKISYLLRHNPEDLTMDKEGWVNVSDLLFKVNITFEELDNIVKNNDKKRFSFNENNTQIRAVQGHSKNLNLNLKYNVVRTPTIYYHGTIKENLRDIMKNGLISKSREYVHLSKDVETANKVGMRHGKNVVILSINGFHMKIDGLQIFESENGVILTKGVPSKYISQIT